MITIDFGEVAHISLDPAFGGAQLTLTKHDGSHVAVKLGVGQITELATKCGRQSAERVRPRTINRNYGERGYED